MTVFATLLLAAVMQSDDWANAFSDEVEDVVIEKPLVESDAPESDDHEPVVVQIPMFGPKVLTLPKADKPQKPMAWVDKPNQPAKPAQSGWRSQITSAIRFDDHPPRELMQSPKRRTVMLCVPQGHPECWSQNGQLTPKAKAFRAHPLFDVQIWGKPCGAEQFPAVYVPDLECYFHGPALQSWDILIAEINDECRKQDKKNLQLVQAGGAVTNGGVKQDLLDIAVAFFEFMPNSPALPGDNEAWKETQGNYSITIPANAGISWETAYRKTTIKFAKPPVVKWLEFESTLSAIVIKPDAVTLCIDWFPDWTLEGE